MKKIILLPTLTFLIFFTLSSFKNRSLKLSSNTPLYGKVYQRERTVVAYVTTGGSWQKGQITYLETSPNYQPVSYYFGGGNPAQNNIPFFLGQRFRRLNPDDPLAKNFTHTIETEVGIAYLSLY